MSAEVTTRGPSSG